MTIDMCKFVGEICFYVADDQKKRSSSVIHYTKTRRMGGRNGTGERNVLIAAESHEADF